MSGFCKYYKQKKQVSYDNGATWQDVYPAEYQKGSLYETNSTDCGYIASFERWTQSGTTCNGENLYKLMVYQTSSDGVNWVTTDQTRLGDLIEAGSSQCSANYRWVETDEYGCHKENMPLGNYKICGYRYIDISDKNKGLEWFEIPCDYQRIFNNCSAQTGVLSAIDSAQYASLVDSPWNPSYTTYSARNIKTAYIGDCVTYIGSGTFGAMTPDPQTEFCRYYDGENQSLETVIMADSVESIAGGLFKFCYNLTNVELSKNLQYIMDGAFYYCVSLPSITIPDSVNGIGIEAFAYCSSIPSIVIPDNVNVIQERAFYNCTGLTSVTIGSGVTSIKYGAFAYCSGLTSIIIPDSVTDIGGTYDGVNDSGVGVFANCTNLTSVTIGSGATYIHTNAFANCKNLINLTIPKYTLKIGDAIFDGCEKLTTLTVKATTPPAKANSDTHSLGVLNSLQTIYVPIDSVNAYKSATFWSQYSNIIVGINI